MVDAVSPGYILLDPRPVAAEAPYTFFIPTAGQLAAIGVGDLVKLIFEHVPAGHKMEVERMWVVVSSSDAEGLTGTLDNNPGEPSASIRLGDLVRFDRHHVIAIRWSNPETAPLSAPHREYWERCLVDDCVLDGTEPVEFIYREEPDIGSPEDKHPDSGWRIRGRVGDATNEEVDARTVRYISIAFVLNRDDSWLPFINAPVGTRLLRDFGANIYSKEA